MARAPRVIIKGRVYEIVPRVREGLPLPPTKTTNILLGGILARTQRDEKVTLCNYVIMNNHGHIHAIPDKPEQLSRFYGEFQKKTTDTVRALLGQKSLRLWEDRTSVIMLDGLEDVINRLVYAFCNPAKADLVDSIDDYCGLNTWHAFTTCKPSVDAEVQIQSSWHPVASLPELPANRVLSETQDRALSARLLASKDSVRHVLVVKPFAWLAHFGISEPAEIEEIRQGIIRRVRENEAEYRAKRLKDHKAPMGVEKLKCQPYMKAHTPKQKSRKIFLICANKERRLELLRFFQDIFARCRECYEKVKSGISAVWPPGTFTPWLPPGECYVL